MSTRETPGERLAQLFHHRWAVPVLAELQRTSGSRFVTLHRRLGIGRETLSRTLAALGQQGLVVRNPGYGHPLRPEYVLTDQGRAVGPACAELMHALDALQIAAIGLNKWSMPVVAALDAAGSSRFAQLRESLPPVSPRALTLALKALAEAGLVERTVVDSFPPTAVYSLAADGRAVSPALRALAAA
jgi:DNA-binding HxlR family transcriptional regulator